MRGSRQYILGLSAFYHDSAASILCDGEIVAAAQEERFTRKKGDASFPEHAAAYCLAAVGIDPSGIDFVGFYDKPLLKWDRIWKTCLAVAPLGFSQFSRAGPIWIKDKIFLEKIIRRSLGYEGRILYAEHHESHAASAFFPSPFEEAAILTVDGVGEWATAALGVGQNNDIVLLRELHWPDSLGLLFSAFTSYLGFKVNSGEHKVMGLASYGEPRYVDIILRELIDLREDGSFKINQRYFSYLTGLTMTNRIFNYLFGGPPRVPESPITKREVDLARSIQVVCEEIMLRMTRKLHKETGLNNLCLGGGVALNCVVNGRILREGPFERLWIQPAAGDAGSAIGVAQLIWHRYCREPRDVTLDQDKMKGALLGPEYSPDQIEAFLRVQQAPAEQLDRRILLQRVAELLARQKVVGWFNGRMEFGPRALGARSILGDPRSPDMQSIINLKIKFREGFRPFAPSVIAERTGEFFELNCNSPYMLLVASVKKERQIVMSGQDIGISEHAKRKRLRANIPAVTHIDCSARVQTVHRETNPDFYDLITMFEELTGCPVLVNTSFNVRGEPIVCTPADAYDCFMRTDIDYLVLGPYLLDKTAQPTVEKSDWQKDFPPD